MGNKIPRSNSAYSFGVTLIAVALGVASILFIRQMGVGAGGALLISVIGGAILLSAIGSTFRILYNGVFGMVIFGGLVVLEEFRAGGILILLGVSLGLPLVIAVIVKRFGQRFS